MSGNTRQEAPAARRVANTFVFATGMESPPVLERGAAHYALPHWSALPGGHMATPTTSLPELPESFPLPRTRLIGRDAERARARSLLLEEAVPLLTLTGP